MTKRIQYGDEWFKDWSVALRNGGYPELRKVYGDLDLILGLQRKPIKKANFPSPSRAATQNSPINSAEEIRETMRKVSWKKEN